MTTTNLGMTKPTVGGDADAWGGELNTDLDLIDTFAGTLMPGAEVTIASAGTTNIGGAASTAVLISGTTGISSFGVVANCIRLVRFAGVLTLTHNGTSLILPGGMNIATAANDMAIFKSDGSGNWRCYHYLRATGQTVISSNGVSGVIVNQQASPGACYEANAITNAGTFYYMNMTGGTGGLISNNGSVTSYATTSDERLKDWEFVTQSDKRAKIEALWVGDFNWKKDGGAGFGVRAQQAYEVLGPISGVTETAEGVFTAPSEPFGLLALWGVKDQYKTLAALESRIAALESKAA